MSLAGVKGQQIAVKFLQEIIKGGRLGGTYLFTGPEGVGKKYTAINLIKIVNCETKKPDSCDKCPNCKRIEKLEYPDLLFVVPEGKKRQILIDHIRKIRDFLSLKTFEGGYKAVIIDDAHRMNDVAANAFLKILEEPPPRTVIILITHLPDNLLPTIVSRTQIVPFVPLPKKVLGEILQERFEIPEEELEFYMSVGDGSVSRVEDLLDPNYKMLRKTLLSILSREGCSVVEVEEIILKIKEIIDGIKEDEVEGGSPSIGDAYKNAEINRKMERIFEIMKTWYRDLLIFKHTNDTKSVLNKDLKEEILLFSEKFLPEELLQKMEAINRAEVAFSRNISLKHILFTLFAELEIVR